jgi:hypothetical protein
MPSETYRYYRLDGVGHLEGAEWFEADNDEDAIAQVSSKHPKDKCEIREGKRLVASISPNRLRLSRLRVNRVGLRLQFLSRPPQGPAIVIVPRVFREAAASQT